MFEIRPYQQQAIDAVHNFICTKEGNPCVSLPTGSGKSVVMAELIKKWQEETPNVRGCILAHRKELVKQNHEKFNSAYSGYDQESKQTVGIRNDRRCLFETNRTGGSGIFSAGLGRRDYESPIIFASIDSIYKKSGEFEPFDFIFVDEAHRIPFHGEGKYRTFLAGCRRFNPKLRIVGWTATPWRMAGGQLCHKDHILNNLVYEAKLTELIENGYLSKLRSKVGVNVPNLQDVERYSGGDYKLNSLSKATNQECLVYDAVSEAVRIIVRENRKYAIFYCVDINHCEKVSRALASHNVYAPYITSKTSKWERDKLVTDFHEGRINAVCNVNVLTEGFDAPHIDCIVLLRPTLSAGLFSQMVGRGLRISIEGRKEDCLVLDFAGCIDEHGPIDLLGGSPTVMAVCKQCRESFSRALKVCPKCGWILPKEEIKRIEDVERNKRMHGKKPSDKSILSNEPEILKVDSIYVSRHKKPGNPDSVRIQFRSGLRMHRYWFSLDAPGTAGILAQQKWRGLFPVPRGHIVTVDEVLSDLFISEKLLDTIKTITVQKQGKWYNVIAWNQPLNAN